MAKQRQAANASDDPEKQHTRIKDTPEMAESILEAYASISTGLGDLHDLAEGGTKTASATLELYSQLIDEIADFEKKVHKLRTRVFKQTCELKIIAFKENLSSYVKNAVNNLRVERGESR